MDACDVAEAELVRDAMAKYAGAVCVVTVGSGSELTGVTVTSMTSVAMSPPTLLFCLNRSSSALPILEKTRCFAVNVLASRHLHIADEFAGRTPRRGSERFQCANWRTLRTGAPILADAVSAFDCEIDETIQKHTHLIVIGRIRAIHAAAGAHSPLIYWRRAYRELHAADHEADHLLMAVDW